MSEKVERSPSPTRETAGDISGQFDLVQGLQLRREQASAVPFVEDEITEVGVVGAREESGIDKLLDVLGQEETQWDGEKLDEGEEFSAEEMEGLMRELRLLDLEGDQGILVSAGMINQEQDPEVQEQQKKEWFEWLETQGGQEWIRTDDGKKWRENLSRELDENEVQELLQKLGLLNLESEEDRGILSSIGIIDSGENLEQQMQQKTYHLEGMRTPDGQEWLRTDEGKGFRDHFWYEVDYKELKDLLGWDNPEFWSDSHKRKLGERILELSHLERRKLLRQQQVQEADVLNLRDQLLNNASHILWDDAAQREQYLEEVQNGDSWEEWQLKEQQNLEFENLLQELGVLEASEAQDEENPFAGDKYVEVFDLERGGESVVFKFEDLSLKEWRMQGLMFLISRKVSEGDAMNWLNQGIDSFLTRDRQEAVRWLLGKLRELKGQGKYVEAEGLMGQSIDSLPEDQQEYVQERMLLEVWRELYYMQ